MKTINNIHKTVFAVLGAACLAGIILAGAWWHIGSLVICYFMFNAYDSEEEDINNQ
jgi:hypothetical protein